MLSLVVVKLVVKPSINISPLRADKPKKVL
jgi:hypothetical protein